MTVYNPLVLFGGETKIWGPTAAPSSDFVSIFHLYGTKEKVHWATESLLREIPKCAEEYLEEERRKYLAMRYHPSHFRDDEIKGKALYMILSHNLISRISLPAPRKKMQLNRDQLERYIVKRGGYLISADFELTQNSTIVVRCRNNHSCYLLLKDLSNWCEMCNCLSQYIRPSGGFISAEQVFTSLSHVFAIRCPKGHHFTATISDCKENPECPVCRVENFIFAQEGIIVSVLSQYHHMRTQLRMKCNNCNLTFYASEKELEKKQSCKFNCDVMHVDTETEYAHVVTILKQVLELIFRDRFDDSMVCEKVYFTALSFRFGLACTHELDKIPNVRRAISAEWAKNAGFRFLMIGRASKAFDTILSAVVDGLERLEFIAFAEGQKNVFINDLKSLHRILNGRHRPFFCADC